jgi:transposase
MSGPWVVSDELWRRIQPLLPARPRESRDRQPGRRSLDDRLVLCGILYVLINGVPWTRLPAELGYGSGMTCWRRLRAWQETGAWPKVRAVLTGALPAAERVDWSRAEATVPATVARRRARISFHLPR